MLNSLMQAIYDNAKTVQFLILFCLPHVLYFFLSIPLSPIFSFFFFNDTATTEIYTLSLHDALPISPTDCPFCFACLIESQFQTGRSARWPTSRSEEHTSELQSQSNLVCRLLLEKKKKKKKEIG